MPVETGAVSHNDLVSVANEIRTQAYEDLKHNTEAFNQATKGALTMVVDPKWGSMNYETKITRMDDLWRIRDIYSTDPLAERKLHETRHGFCKVDLTTDALTIHPDAFEREGRSRNEFIDAGSNMISRGLPTYYLKLALTSLIACLTKPSPSGNPWVYDITGHPSDNMLSRYSEDRSRVERFGDSRDELVTWCKHSQAVQQTGEDLIGEMQGTESGIRALRGGMIDRHGMAVFEGDLDSFQASPAVPPDDAGDLFSAALKPGAVTIYLNEEPVVLTEEHKMYENPVLQLRFYCRADIKVKGFGWNEQTGGISPGETELASGVNWTPHIAEDKSMPGYLIRHKAGYREKAT